MRAILYILIIFSLTMLLYCTQHSNNGKVKTEMYKEISIDSYDFISDTTLIQNLVKYTVCPSGKLCTADNYVNHFVKISMINNLDSTIFLPKSIFEDLSSKSNSTISYCILSRFSSDSNTWQKPSGVSDFFPEFTVPVPSKKTITGIFSIEPFVEAKYFEVSLHYKINDSIKTQKVILKL